MAGLTVGNAITPWNAHEADRGVTIKRFSAAAAAGDITTIQAAGAAATRHIVTHIGVDSDTAGENLAVVSGAEILRTLRMPVAGNYEFHFDPVLECNAAETLRLDKATTAAVTGEIHYVAGAVAGAQL